MVARKAHDTHKTISKDRSLSMIRGFTLVEFIVVLSIIGVLTTLAIASTQSTRSTARDSKRIQEIRQIDLAVRLYIGNKGHAPDLQGQCAVQQVSTPNTNQASACFAVSTAIVGPQTLAWSAFEADIAQYMPSVPRDPCSPGPSCLSMSGLPIGYSYVSPLAMQYFCDQVAGGCNQSAVELNQTYQLYAPLERNIQPIGFLNTSSSLKLGTFNTPLAVVPQGSLSVSLSDQGSTGDTWMVSWNSMWASSCSGSDTLGMLNNSMDMTTASGTVALLVPGEWDRSGQNGTSPQYVVSGQSDTLIFVCSGPGGQVTSVHTVTNP
jgi:prepilin-type N-terminal cleavage/methylation domain-containing protein